jgi:hypothetical protein
MVLLSQKQECVRAGWQSDRARYAHLAADPLRAADDAVGEMIAAAMQHVSSDSTSKLTA